MHPQSTGNEMAVEETPNEASGQRAVSQKVMTRLQTIEVVLNWEGGINGAQLSRWYGITTRQASQDLALYAEHNPGGMSYNGSSKQYEVEPGFSPRIFGATERDYLRHIASFADPDSSDISIAAEPEGLDMLSLPAPRSSMALFRELVRAVRNGSVISIHSLVDDPESDSLEYRHFQQLSPLKLVHLPIGWHMRFYDYVDRSFGLMRINRIYGEVQRTHVRKSAPYDKAWNSMNWFVGEPSPRLSNAQSQLVLADWGIASSSQMMIPVREAIGGVMLMLLNNLDNRLRFRVVPLTDQRWAADPIKDQEIDQRMRELNFPPIPPNR